MPSLEGKCMRVERNEMIEVLKRALKYEAGKTIELLEENENLRALLKRVLELWEEGQDDEVTLPASLMDRISRALGDFQS
jgi:hypothetical protein